MTTFRDRVYAAVQDAPNLTAKEYAVLLDAKPQQLNSCLGSLRNTGYVTSTQNGDRPLVWSTAKPYESSTRSHNKRIKTVPSEFKITKFVRVEHNGSTFELPFELIEALRGYK